MKYSACVLAVIAAVLLVSCASPTGQKPVAVTLSEETAQIAEAASPVATAPTRVTLDLGTASVTPGDLLAIKGCIPPVRPDKPVDIYLLFEGPRGRRYSVHRSGAIKKGISPFEKGVTTLPDGWCGVLHDHVACSDAPPGEYTVALIVMPVNKKVSYKKALGYDKKKLTITWP